VVTGLLLLVVGWAGAGTIADRFGTGQEDVVSRSRVWADAVGVFQRYPLAGTGFNTYDVAMVFYQRFEKPLRYSRAHNDYLQLAAEGGLLLTVPAAICAVMLARGVRRRFVMERRRSAYWARRGAVVGILAVALQDVADFSLQMPGNAFLFAVLCAIALHRTPDRP
jgi:O-antigen ligase